MFSLPAMAAVQDKSIGNAWQSKFREEISLKNKKFNAIAKHDSKKRIIVSGNNVWHKGNKFTSGQNWLGLYCLEGDCKWIPASLKTKKETIWVGWGKYDEGYEKIKGQVLTFETKQPDLSNNIVMWVLNKPNSPRWLKQQVVETHYIFNGSNINTELNEKNQLFETQFNDNQGALKSIIPMKLNQHSNETWLNETFLQIRERDKRQFLLSSLSASECEIVDVSSVPNYLLWAGDMDQDGKTDYIINFSPNSNHVHLYLSANAIPTEIVDLAGVFDARQNMAGCLN